MSASEVSCPACSTRLQLPPGNTATRFRCTQCGTVFDMPAPVPMAAPAPPPPPPPQPEPVPAAAPAPAPVPVPVFVLPDARSRDDEDEDDRPRRKKRRRRDEDEEDEDEKKQKPRPSYARKSGPSGGLVAALACVGALVLVGVVVGGYYAFRDPPKPATAGKGEGPKETGPQPKPKDKDATKAAPAPTREQMIKKVKASTVYIKTYVRSGPYGTGTGFFAGKPGFIVTNAHVIGYGPRELKVPVKVEVVIERGERNERTVVADVYGVDVDADLALLRVNEGGLPPPLPLGKSDELIETQEVVAFGYPFSQLLEKGVSINTTTVSSLRRANGQVDQVQLAGGLNPGNSGGPVVNAKGEVVGVSVAKLRVANNIDFAISAEKTDRFVDNQFARGGQIQLGDLAGVVPNELEGTYLLVGLEGRGTKLTEDDLKKVDKDERKFVITGNTLVAWKKGKIDPATIRVDDTRTPGHFDIVSVNGGVPEVSYGIYKFEDGMLTICTAEKGGEKDRPKEFKGGEKLLLITLKKQSGK